MKRDGVPRSLGPALSLPHRVRSAFVGRARHAACSPWRVRAATRHSGLVILHMPYHYLEEIGTADIAFEATGRDLRELFMAAADATMNVMIDNLDAIEPRETRHIELSNDKLDMLLFDFLQELIYFKDAERLLLRVRDVRIEERDGKHFLKAEAAGEPLDAARHHQRADVKAVTLHDFSVEKQDDGWKARVLLDI
jgi:SHS2 domain-containing protein